MTKSLVSSRLPNQRQTQPAGGKGTSHQSTSTIQAHTLTTRMHFNFPPCCVHTQRAGNVAEGGGGVPATSSNCCKSAKPQMLSVTQKSTLSQQQQQQPRQNHQTNPPQSVPLPFSAYSLPLVALHALAAVDKALQFACHLLWQLIVGLPRCQTPVATRAYCRLPTLGNC